MADPIIDIPDVLRRIEGDKELLIELVEIFLEDCPHKLSDITQGLAVQDAVALYEAGHSAKGASGNIGAKKLWATFWEIEKKAKEGDLGQIPALREKALREFNELKEYFPALKEELKQI